MGTVAAERQFVRELVGIQRGIADLFVRYLEKAGRAVTTDAASGNPSRDVAHLLADVMPQARAKVIAAHRKLEGKLVDNYDKAMATVFPIGFESLPSTVKAESERARIATVELMDKARVSYSQQMLEVFSDTAKAQGTRWEDLKAQLMERGVVSESRAELIARDQTLKLNGSINQCRQQALGIDSYVWDTSGDERVRDEHQALDGQEFRWDSPPDVGNPGQDFQCRCIGLPVIAIFEGI